MPVLGYRGGSRLAGGWAARGTELFGRPHSGSTPAPGGAASTWGRFCGRPRALFCWGAFFGTEAPYTSPRQKHNDI